MGSLLIKNADYIITMDAQNTVYTNCDMYIEDGIVQAIGSDLSVLNSKAKKEIKAKGHAVYPGLVNSHHHFYQILTRNFPLTQNMELYEWLKTLYGYWERIDGEMLYTAALVAMTELIKYGCTTTVDHHYIFPKGQFGLIDQEIKAASKLGMRLIACRGSLNKGVSNGGLALDSLVEKKENILADSERLIKEYHDPSVGSMCQIALAPCSPHSVTPDLLIESAELARQYGVRLHTHLAVTQGEIESTAKVTGMRPLAYMESLGWLGEDVWFAHLNHFTSSEVTMLAETKTGIAHCSVSNQKLACGVSNVAELLSTKIHVGLAVDGSSSNDCGSMLAEIKSSYNINRLKHSYQAPTAKDVLYLATRGSGTILGRDDIGSLEVGKAGDCFLINTNCAEFAGALDDLRSLPAVVGINRTVDMTIINGEIVFEKGTVVNIDESGEARKLNKMALKVKYNS
jgi:cytosine/adenosine deaminase-related metal-dependent hydrolase